MHEVDNQHLMQARGYFRGYRECNLRGLSKALVVSTIFFNVFNKSLTHIQKSCENSTVSTTYSISLAMNTLHLTCDN